MSNITDLLFSYGTLQKPSVQQKTFGRKLSGHKDKLPNYKLATLKIQDKDVVALSGETDHPIAIIAQDEYIAGTVFEMTPEELKKSDEYEVDAYQRVKRKLESGKWAWVYVSKE